MPLRVSILASQGIPLVPRYPWFFVPLRPDPCPPKTRADLEWDHLLSAIADRCAGALGRQRAASLSFALTREEAASWQEEAVEATRTLRQGTPLPAADVPDVREALERARRGAVLSPEDLRAIGAMLGAARALRCFLGASRAKLPALYRACSVDPGLDVPAESIARCFEPDGSLSDGASPLLKELRA